MRFTRAGALVATLLVVPMTEAAAQSPPLGARVRVIQSGSLPRLRGELIAVSHDSLWLLRDFTLLTVPSRDLVRVEVKRRPLGGNDIMLWGLIGGAISGVALTAACASYTDDCDGVLPGVLLSWTLWSGIWALVAGSSYQSYPAEKLQTDVSAFARFPGGPPSAFDYGRLRPLPTDTIRGRRRR